MSNSWNKKTFLSRINSTAQRERYHGGSPNSMEVELYKSALSDIGGFDSAVIMGMTPELRNLAVSCFSNISSIDESDDAIELYRDWLDDEGQQRENIIKASWFDLEQHITQPVDAIFGDGIFGNLPDLSSHRELLSIIFKQLSNNGRFVTRKILIPRQFDPSTHSFETLLRKFRAGEIDEAEFGFGVRLVGHYSSCYNESDYILNNKKVFDDCEKAHRSGMLNDEEIALINRYYFSGKNCILSQDLWESTLRQEGFEFKLHQCQGKAWYEYYIIYECFKAS